jgi:hypothetical protein
MVHIHAPVKGGSNKNLVDGHFVRVGACILKSQRKRTKPKFVKSRKRLGDLRILAKYLWSTGPYSNDFRIPDSELGKTFVESWVQHGKYVGHTGATLQAWADEYANWYGHVDTRSGPSRCSSRLPTDEALGHRLQMTAEIRNAINEAPGRGGKITTIAPCDQTREQRQMSAKERKKRQDKARRNAERRAAAMQPRAEYEGQSLSKTMPWKVAGASRAQWYRQNAMHGEIKRMPSAKPWVALGISRATYYRDRSETRNETGPSRTTLTSYNTTHLSHFESHRDSSSTGSHQFSDIAA